MLPKRITALHAVYEAVQSARLRDILALQPTGNAGMAIFVGILATTCRMLILAGVVVDGYIRAVDEVKQPDLPVFGRGNRLGRRTRILAEK